MDYAFLLAVTLVASTLSGVTSTGGGFLLMGAFALVLPMDVAIQLHAALFLIANLTRVLLLRGDVQWAPVLRYLAGLAVGACGGALLWSRYGAPPGLRVLLAGIGLAAVWWPRAAAPPASSAAPGEGPPAAGGPVFLAVGATAGALAMFVGATGPLTAPFFLRNPGSKEARVATNSTASVLTHAAKLVAFTGVGRAGPLLEPRWLPLVAAVLVGTWTGRQLLRRVSARQFEWLIRGVVTAVALALIARELAPAGG